jgi:hypothetical protein
MACTPAAAIFSIREFIASVISEDRDTAEDLLRSSIRLKQVSSLWELSAARPGCELAALFASNPGLLTQTIPRLLEGPWIRWEKSRDGLRGFGIDMADEARIGFIVELSEAQQSTELLTLASKAADRLVAGWSRAIPSFMSVLRLLNGISENRWFAAHGGRAMHRKLLDGMLNHLNFATASDWLELVALRERAVNLTEDHQSTPDRGLKEYCENGVGDDRRDLTRADEKSDLKDSLAQLGTKVGYDFSYDIRRLEEDIAERKEEPESLNEGSGIGIPSETLTLKEVVTDDDVRQMFSTLGNE